MRNRTADLVEGLLVEVALDGLVTQYQRTVRLLIEDLDHVLLTLQKRSLRKPIIDDQVAIDCS